MGPDFFAYNRKIMNQIKIILDHGAANNYGLMADSINQMYLECANLDALMDGHLEEMAEANGGKIVIDGCGGMMDENEKEAEKLDAIEEYAGG